MSHAPIRGIQACVFDAYGTLFDVASAARTCAGELGEESSALSSLWREKQLETLQITRTGLRERLLNLYLTLGAFPEVPEVLARLKRAGMRTAVLSNGSPQMLKAALEGAQITHLLDAVLSVEEVGIYKPHPRVYQLAVDRLGLEPGAIAFQSSNAWDAYAGSAFGMRVVWCNRYDQPPERLPGKPDQEIRSLEELPALLGIQA
jgi:2-haloacid dehalogenase